MASNRYEFWAPGESDAHDGNIPLVVSHAACEEGLEHEQSGQCVIDPFMAPAFLGFEYWKTVGITLGVVASGLVVASIMLARAD